MFLHLCPPAFIYLIFSLIQICIDSFNGLLEMAFIKLLVMIVVTFLLNTLCGSGLSIVSWIIVLAPFIFMLVSASILLYVFGTNVQSKNQPVVDPSNPPPVPPPVPPPIPPPKPCHIEETQNWGVYNGNIVFLPTYTRETVC